MAENESGKRFLIVFLAIVVIIFVGPIAYFFATTPTTTQTPNICCTSRSNEGSNSTTLTETSTTYQSITSLSSFCTMASPELNATSRYPFGEGVSPITFHINQSSSMFACVAFYYYNETSLSIDPLSYISLSAMINNSAYSVNALVNFSITASSRDLTIGNTVGGSEGAIVAYLIHANPVSNGTYNLNLAWTYNPGPYDCTTDYYLAVGNGLPNYTYQGSCITMSVTDTSNVFQGVVFTKLLEVGNVSV